MTHHAFFNPLEKAFRFYAGLYLAIILFQGVGLLNPPVRNPSQRAQPDEG